MKEWIYKFFTYISTKLWYLNEKRVRIIFINLFDCSDIFVCFLVICANEKIPLIFTPFQGWICNASPSFWMPSDTRSLSSSIHVFSPLNRFSVGWKLLALWKGQTCFIIFLEKQHWYEEAIGCQLGKTPSFSNRDVDESNTAFLECPVWVHDIILSWLLSCPWGFRTTSFIQILSFLANLKILFICNT